MTAMDFDTIALDAADALRPFLEKAFEAGRAVGREEATAELRARLSDLVGPLEAAPTAPEPKRVFASGSFTLPRYGAPAEGARATPGTVKPAIFNLIRSHPNGIRQDDIRRLSDVKANSIRGTLYSLQKDGVIERRGERWFAMPETNEAADDDPSKEPSAASDHQPEAQGREAGPGGVL